MNLHKNGLKNTLYQHYQHYDMQALKNITLLIIITVSYGGVCDCCLNSFHPFVSPHMHSPRPAAAGSGGGSY